MPAPRPLARRLRVGLAGEGALEERRLDRSEDEDVGPYASAAWSRATVRVKAMTAPLEAV
jgi:hypothetical protein